jgi:hypothetical protein
MEIVYERLKEGKLKSIKSINDQKRKDRDARDWFGLAQGHVKLSSGSDDHKTSLYLTSNDKDNYNHSTSSTG